MVLVVLTLILLVHVTISLKYFLSWCLSCQWGCVLPSFCFLVPLCPDEGILQLCRGIINVAFCPPVPVCRMLCFIPTWFFFLALYALFWPFCVKCFICVSLICFLLLLKSKLSKTKPGFLTFLGLVYHPWPLWRFVIYINRNQVRETSLGRAECIFKP